MVRNNMDILGANPERVINRQPLSPRHRLVLAREGPVNRENWKPTRAQLDSRPPTPSEFGTAVRQSRTVGVNAPLPPPFGGPLGVHRELVGDGGQGNRLEGEAVHEFRRVPIWDS